MIIQSRGGLGKSRLAEDVLNEDVLFFGGHVTPLKMYLTLYENPDKLVVFDDVDELLYNKKNVALLKQLCEVTNDKIIRYATTSTIKGNKKEGDKEIPSSFVSHNKVMILCNDFKRVGKNLRALQTRGIFINFDPSDTEILTVLETFAKDKEIFQYLETYSDQIQDLNFRTYIKCVELKRSKINWVNYLKSEFKINFELELALEIRDLETRERNKIWVMETGKSIKTLQRRLKRIKKGVK